MPEPGRQRRGGKAPDGATPPAPRSRCSPPPPPGRWPSACRARSTVDAVDHHCEHDRDEEHALHRCGCGRTWIADALPQIERLQVVDLQPGDHLVATVPASTSSEQAAELARTLKARFPDSEIVVVAGLELSAMRPVLVVE